MYAGRPTIHVPGMNNEIVVLDKSLKITTLRVDSQEKCCRPNAGF
jgi:hypothetical protein